jgi:hypothetical protein
MADYVWPGFPVNRFEMKLMPNTRIFTAPYAPTTQVLDLFGERWSIIMTLTPTVMDEVTGAALEAFWDRLKAQANRIVIGHQKRKLPLGTLRGTAPATWHTAAAVPAAWHTASAAPASWSAGRPRTAFAVAQFTNTLTIRTLPGITLLAGDNLGIAGQLIRCMANATADGSGLMVIEFQPRLRQAVPAGTVVVYDSPTAKFILKPGTSNVPTSWTPGVVDGASVEFIEDY